MGESLLTVQDVADRLKPATIATPGGGGIGAIPLNFVVFLTLCPHDLARVTRLLSQYQAIQ